MARLVLVVAVMMIMVMVLMMIVAVAAMAVVMVIVMIPVVVVSVVVLSVVVVVRLIGAAALVQGGGSATRGRLPLLMVVVVRVLLVLREILVRLGDWSTELALGIMGRYDFDTAARICRLATITVNCLVMVMIMGARIGGSSLAGGGGVGALGVFAANCLGGPA